ncbi:MAG: hypothetical protein OHK0015_01700 [Chloroflexi bacterium OHK40]
MLAPARPLLNILAPSKAINHDPHARVGRVQRREPAQLRCAGELAGNQQVVDTRRGHHLGLAQFGHAEDTRPAAVRMRAISGLVAILRCGRTCTPLGRSRAISAAMFAALPASVEAPV